MCLFQVPLIHAIVAPLFMPDYPTRMSISATMRFSHPPCYLQDRDETADDVIIAQSRKSYVKVTAISVHPLTVQSGISSRATVASIKVLFRGIKASIHTRFVLSHAHGLSILHCQEQYFSFVPGNLPVFQLDATVRASFMPDSTLEFLPIFSNSKCAKVSIFSGFLHSLRWFDPQKLPRCFPA